MATSKKTSISRVKPALATGQVMASPKALVSPVKPAQTPAKNAPKANAVVKKAAVKQDVARKVSARKIPAKPLLADIPAPAKPEKLATAPKPKKPKLVRDSFTLPKTEYGVLEELKQRAAKLARPIKKSELLRAGIKMLASATDAVYLAALEAVPAIKTGRPALKK